MISTRLQSFTIGGPSPIVCLDSFIDSFRPWAMVRCEGNEKPKERAKRCHRLIFSGSSIAPVVQQLLHELQQRRPPTCCRPLWSWPNKHRLLQRWSPEQLCCTVEQGDITLGLTRILLHIYREFGKRPQKGIQTRDRRIVSLWAGRYEKRRTP